MDASAWASALVATVRQDEASVGSKPAAIERRLVAFGVMTVLGVLGDLGERAPITPETLDLLGTLRELVESPRRRSALKERLARGWAIDQMSKPGGLVVSPRASPTDLAAGAATYLSAAAMAGSLVDAQRLVTGAIERLVLATSRDQIMRVVLAGMVRAGLPELPRPARRKRR